MRQPDLALSESRVPPYQLVIDGFGEDFFRILAFEGKESLSSSYRFEVTVTTRATDARIERAILHRRARFLWNLEGSDRAFYGLIASARIDPVAANDGASQYRIRFVPRLWLLTQVKRSRIFYNMRIPDVAAALLREVGIGVRFQLLRAHPTFEHLTQYQETNYAFLRRLLAEAGILFYFASGPRLEHEAHDGVTDPPVPGDTIIACDDATFYPVVGPRIAGTRGHDVQSAAAPKLYFLTTGDVAASSHDKITRFGVAESLVHNAATLRDRDFTKPEHAVGSKVGPADPAEEPSVPASSTPRALLEVYEHEGPALVPAWPFAMEEAARMLRRAKRRAAVASGEGGCSGLAPGHRFTLGDHPAARLDRPYVVTSVEHRGQLHAKPGTDWQVYGNCFECVPADTTYLPARPKRENIAVMLTATVVGPVGEDVHVNALGQIKVQFHWDREGAADDENTCWIRVMQPWAGAGWGHQFIPRVGTEVVVAFEGGDPNKPLVTGSVYNGTHLPPFPLPKEKTKSGIRTKSTPGGGGHNEISFEDAAGRELVHIHAQRDLDEVVEKNRTLLVKNEDRITVLADRIDRIQQNLDQHVFGNQRSRVEGDRVGVVVGNADDRVTGAAVSRVEGTEQRSVRGPSEHNYADDMTLRVDGCLTTVVGTNEAPASWVTHAVGAAEVFSTDAARVGSAKEIVLAVGKSSIRISDGMVEINAPKFAVNAPGAGFVASDRGLRVSSSTDAEVVVGKKLVLRALSSLISMENEVRIDGVHILLNSAKEAKDTPPKDPNPPTKVELLEDSGNALAFQRFVVELADGSTVSGMTDKNGRAELDLPMGGQISFPDLTDTKVS